MPVTSLGAMLFAVVFASLALARRFWFRIPFRGLAAANVLYLGGLVAAWI